MIRYLSEDDVRKLVRGIVDSAGSQSAAAHLIGVSPVYLCSYLGGHKRAGTKIRTMFRLQRIVVYTVKP